MEKPKAAVVYQYDGGVGVHLFSDMRAARRKFNELKDSSQFNPDSENLELTKEIIIDDE